MYIYILYMYIYIHTYINTHTHTTHTPDADAGAAADACACRRDESSEAFCMPCSTGEKSARRSTAASTCCVSFCTVVPVKQVN